MKAFLLIRLAASFPRLAYSHPFPDHIKSSYPDVAVFDIDGYSDEMMQQYALRLMRESESCIVCFEAEENDAIDKVMALLEEMLQPDSRRLIMLSGEHTRLQRIFGARPMLNFIAVENAEAFYKEVKNFYEG